MTDNDEMIDGAILVFNVQLQRLDAIARRMAAHEPFGPSINGLLEDMCGALSSALAAYNCFVKPTETV